METNKAISPPICNENYHPSTKPERSLLLINSRRHQSSDINQEIISSNIKNNSTIEVENQQDITVKNEDFFAALHLLMRNKHNSVCHVNNKRPEDNHKV